MANPDTYSDTNLLLRDIEYKLLRTSFGVWHSFMYDDGKTYHEFTSHSTLAGVPLLHYTSGICPETGGRKVAKGIVAIGRMAVGMVAIGQASLGMIGIGQATLGFGVGIGQLAVGGAALGQAAIGCAFGLGQLALGFTAIGQFAIGVNVLGQFALKLPF